MRMNWLMRLGAPPLLMVAVVACSSEPSAPEPGAANAVVEAPAAAATAAVVAPPADVSPNPVDAATTQPGPAAEGASRTFVVVPEGTVARYRVQEEFFEGALQRLGRALGITTTVGTTQVVEGQLSITGEPGAAPTGVTGQLVVDISTLTSDSDGRDNRIRERWLESGLFPKATFVPTGLDGFPATYSEGTPVSFKLMGDLTVREVTHAVVFDVTATLAGSTLTGTASTNIKMTDFGFSPPDMAGMFKVADDATIELDFTLQEG